jgi:hypothetical protein
LGFRRKSIGFYENRQNSWGPILPVHPKPGG